MNQDLALGAALPPHAGVRDGVTHLFAMNHRFRGPGRSVTGKGETVSHDVADEARLIECPRETLDLTGTHVSRYSTQNGCCTVGIDRISAKSCNVLAASGVRRRPSRGLARWQVASDAERQRLSGRPR
jgi:hypothetical protein